MCRGLVGTRVRLVVGRGSAVHRWRAPSWKSGGLEVWVDGRIILVGSDIHGDVSAGSDMSWVSAPSATVNSAMA